MAAHKSTAVTLESVVAKETAAIKKYATVPVEVEAAQFQGWDNASVIHSWSNGALFVPEGYEHALRTPEEFNDDGSLLSGASQFLVLKDASGFGTPVGEVRVDLGSWVVKTKDGGIHAYSDDQFRAYYSEMMY